MAMLETFYIWAYPSTGLLEVRIFVVGQHLPRSSRWSRSSPWRKLSKHAQQGPSGHISAGGHEGTVKVDDIANLEETLAIAGVAQSAAAHALSVMRKRQSGYKPSHCPQLAAAATSTMGTTPAKAPLASSDPLEQSEDRETPEPTAAASMVGAGAKSKVDLFKRYDSTGVVLRWLSEFIENALPNPEFDVATHWGLTCMPTTSRGSGNKGLFTLNVGQIEVAYAVASNRPGDTSPSGVAVVSASELESQTGHTIAHLVSSHPRLTFQRVNYVAAQGDDINISWASDDESIAELDSLPWQAASAVLVDSLRTSKCSYGRFHSSALLNEVLNIEPAADWSGSIPPDQP